MNIKVPLSLTDTVEICMTLYRVTVYLIAKRTQFSNDIFDFKTFLQCHLQRGGVLQEHSRQYIGFFHVNREQTTKFASFQNIFDIRLAFIAFVLRDRLRHLIVKKKSRSFC